MESDTSEEQRVKQCPNCKTFVQYDYSVCPNCGHVFEVPKGERKTLRIPTSRPRSETPRTISIIQLLYFFFAAYMLLNGATAMIFLAAEGGLIGGLILVSIGIVDLVLYWFTRRKLRIAYLAGLIIGTLELVGLGLLTGLYVLLTGDLLLTLPIFGLVGMKAIIVFLLFREKNYFTESLSGKKELPVREGISEIPESKEPTLTEPEPEYQSESLQQEINTYLNSAKNSWKIAENAYKNGAWVEYILRADDAIKSLIKGRYLQLFGPIKPGMSILPMVEAIRLRGYQLPEREEFEKWIAFRDDIAKGVEKQKDWEDIIDAYPFYQQVFDKLGFK
jgi:hypothetical protein